MDEELASFCYNSHANRAAKVLMSYQCHFRTVVLLNYTQWIGLVKVYHLGGGVIHTLVIRSVTLTNSLQEDDKV